MAQKGVRFIDGREFLLAGRKADKESAHRESGELRTGWTLVRIVKRHDFDYMLTHHVESLQSGTDEAIMRDLLAQLKKQISSCIGSIQSFSTATK